MRDVQFTKHFIHDWQLQRLAARW